MGRPCLLSAVAQRALLAPIEQSDEEGGNRMACDMLSIDFESTARETNTQYEGWV